MPAELQSIPLSHRDLVERPLVARLTTSMPDGYPQTHPVWFSWEEPHICINTMCGFRKERNMRADPRVPVLVLDPDRWTHWLEIQGTVALIEEGADAHLDRLAWLYTGTDRHFWRVVPAELRDREIPSKGRVTPLRIVTDVQAARRPRRSRPASLNRPARANPSRADRLTCPPPVTTSLSATSSPR